MLTLNRPSVLSPPCEEYIIPPRKEADASLPIPKTCLCFDNLILSVPSTVIQANGDPQKMMLNFWKRIHPLYPFLDRNQFERQYNDIWSSGSPEESPTTIVTRPSTSQDNVPNSRRFHFLLNTIFAVTCSCDTSASGLSQMNRGENYWQRSKVLLEMDFDIFNRPNLHFIQGMLYASIYLQSSTELTGACWNIVGVSIRLAQGLGLHNRNSHTLSSSESLDGRPPVHNILVSSCLRCRIWAGCVMMDRCDPPSTYLVTLTDGNSMLATTYGRPAMISDALADQLLPAKTIEGVETLSGTSNSGFASFIYSLRLQQTLSMITSTLYENSATDDANASSFSSVDIESRLFKAPGIIRKIASGDYQDLVRFESDLSEWEKSLSTCLRVPAVAELLNLRTLPSFDVQAVALRSR